MKVHRKTSFILPIIALLYSSLTMADSLSDRFETLFNEWSASQMPGYESTGTKKNYLLEMSDLGVSAVPLIIEKLKSIPNQIPAQDFLQIVLWNITGKNDFDWAKVHNNNLDHFEAKLTEFYENWWYHGRKDAPKQFQEAYANWKKVKEGGESKEIERALYKIREMGFIVLPFVLEKIKQGDVELISVIHFWTRLFNELKDASVEQCIEWCEKNKEKWYIEIPKGDAEETKTEAH